MSDENKKLLYILIGSGPKPLAGYGEKTGDFVRECENQLGRCQKNKSASITFENCKIFYENVDNVTYLLMTMPAYPLSAGVSCIESLKKEFSTELHGRNFSVVDNYGLNKEMKQRLKMKFDYYNENTEIVSEKLENLKGVMNQYQVQVSKAAKELNERGELLNEMQNKARDLENDSFNFKKGAIKVRKVECSKKVWSIVAIIVVILIVVLIIVLAVMPSSSSSDQGNTNPPEPQPTSTPPTPPTPTDTPTDAHTDTPTDAHTDAATDEQISDSTRETDSNPDSTTI